MTDNVHSVWNTHMKLTYLLSLSSSFSSSFFLWSISSALYFLILLSLSPPFNFIFFTFFSLSQSATAFCGHVFDSVIKERICLEITLLLFPLTFLMSFKFNFLHSFCHLSRLLLFEMTHCIFVEIKFVELKSVELNSVKKYSQGTKCERSWLIGNSTVVRFGGPWFESQRSFFYLWKSLLWHSKGFDFWRVSWTFHQSRGSFY